MKHLRTNQNPDPRGSGPGGSFSSFVDRCAYWLVDELRVVNICR